MIIPALNDLFEWLAKHQKNYVNKGWLLKFFLYLDKVYEPADLKEQQAEHFRACMERRMSQVQWIDKDGKATDSPYKKR